MRTRSDMEELNWKASNKEASLLAELEKLRHEREAEKIRHEKLVIQARESQEKNEQMRAELANAWASVSRLTAENNLHKAEVLVEAIGPAQVGCDLLQSPIACSPSQLCAESSPQKGFVEDGKLKVPTLHSRLVSEIMKQRAVNLGTIKPGSVQVR